MIIGIDASRNRSGGAIAHIVGLLSSVDPSEHNITKIHIWAPLNILNAIPDNAWLIKHNPCNLEKSLLSQIWWQATRLSKEANSLKCDILFTTDASTFCFFWPMVVLSQDLLSYEPGIMKLFGWGKARLRLLAILYLQNLAFRRATGVIFLTRYAAKLIQHSCGNLKNVAYIPHGVNKHFKDITTKQWPETREQSIGCLYVSNTALYKYQWTVVKAVVLLRKQGYKINLTLVGGGKGKAQQILVEQINISDPNKEFVNQFDFVSQNELQNHLSSADMFVFASGCENLPVTLLEAMSAGLPIACSNRGPMPEVLLSAGVYFNPEDEKSIAEAIVEIINNTELRVIISRKARELAEQYTWKRCALETFSFLVKTANQYKQNNI